MEQVEFSIWPGKTHNIGVVRLQNQKALNSLTLEMVSTIGSKLSVWEQSDHIAAVIIYSDLAKAFCAGGDVKTVVLELMKNDPNNYSANFFELEYKMDYIIQSYSKPILVWGNGIVMGGGMGIFCGASHGIVTENTTMAMPEIAIGFFPDVGAGYFLNQIPKGLGLFLAWTAARLNSDDAVSLKFAKAKIQHRKRTEVFTMMRELKWTGKGDQDKKLLSESLLPMAETVGSSIVDRHHLELEKMFSADDPVAIAHEFSEKKYSDPWLVEAQSSFLQGSPLSALVSFEQLKRARQMQALDVFLMEWGIARHMADRHDFREGVRARLIDKENKPKWQHATVDGVSAEEVSSHFLPYIDHEHVRKRFLSR